MGEIRDIEIRQLVKQLVTEVMPATDKALEEMKERAAEIEGKYKDTKPMTEFLPNSDGLYASNMSDGELNAMIPFQDEDYETFEQFKERTSDVNWENQYTEVGFPDGQFLYRFDGDTEAVQKTAYLSECWRSDNQWGAKDLIDSLDDDTAETMQRTWASVQRVSPSQELFPWEDGYEHELDPDDWGGLEPSLTDAEYESALEWTLSTCSCGETLEDLRLIPRDELEAYVDNEFDGGIEGFKADGNRTSQHRNTTSFDFLDDDDTVNVEI